MAHRLELYIQPAYNYDTTTIEYAEVLVRSYRGIQGADKVIKFIHRNNIEEFFDMSVLDETLEILSMSGKVNFPIGFNLCAQTIEKVDIVDQIFSRLAKYGIEPEQLVAEVNEDTDFTKEIVRQNIQKLRDGGLKVALDDFGVGTSNLYTLVNCTVDFLKVDKAFVYSEFAEFELSKSEILRILINLCKKLNIKHIIEGVENKKQLDLLHGMGYNLVQGYLYEKPVPYKEFMKKIATKQESNLERV